MHDHLRPVPQADPGHAADTEPQDGSSDASGDSASRAPGRPRAKKALPTDRLKLDVQKKALSVIAVVSDYGKRDVGAADIAPRLSLSAATAGLNNSFFFESGLIVKESKGRYKPTEAANDFARRYTFDQRRAGLCLKEPLSKTWFFHVVRQELAGMGPATREKLIELLAYEAGATKDHTIQLGSLIAWLEYAELIVKEGGHYQIAANAPKDQGEDEDETPDELPDDEPSNEAEDADETPDRVKAAIQKKPAGREARSEAETVLSFNFDFSLTKEDLAALSPEQIQAVYKAVGEVMAIKASL